MGGKYSSGGSYTPITSEEKLLGTYRKLNEPNQDKVVRYASALLETQNGEEMLRAVEAQREKQA